MNPNSANPFSNMTTVVKNIIIINIAMLLITFIAEETMGYNLTQVLGLHNTSSEHFRPYQFITHLFMHGGLMHLFFNMFSLYMFGRILELPQVWGSKRFFTYYFITGLGAAVLHLIVTNIEFSSIQTAADHFLNSPTPDMFQQFLEKNVFSGSSGLLSSNTDNKKPLYDFIYEWSSDKNNVEYIQTAKYYVQTYVSHRADIPVVGASGAVYGVLLAFGMLFPNVELMLLFPPIPIKAKYMVMVFGAIELFSGLNSAAGDNIAHFAHLGGMIFGFILIKIWQKEKQNFR